MWAAVVDALDNRWTVRDEMTATLLELVDSLIRVTVMANSDPKKRPNLGEPLRWPRPGKKTRTGDGSAKRVPMAQLAKMLAKGGVIGARNR